MSDAPTSADGARTDVDPARRARWRPSSVGPWVRADPFRRWVVVASLLALVVRVAWGLWVDHDPQALYDPARYLGFGREIAAGRGLVEPITGNPTAYYPPGYPWFVGIVTWGSEPIVERTVTAVVLVQAVLGALTVVFGAVVGRALAGRRAGVLTAFGLALYPNLVFHSGAVLGETLYNALFLAFCAVVATTRVPEGLAGRRTAAAGVLLGLAVLVRPISLAILPVAALAWWIGTRDRRVVLRSTALLVVGVVACIAPWTVRNALRMDAFVPISTNTGENLCIGHAPGATGAFAGLEACATEETVLDGPAGEVAADREKIRVAIDAARADPAREVGLLWERFYFTWVRDGDHDAVFAVQSYRSDRFIAEGTERVLIRVADLAYWAVCALGLAGAVVLVRRRRWLDVFVVGSAVMTAAVPLAFFGDARFKVPVIPLLLVLAAAFVASRLGGGAPAADRDDAAEAAPATP